MSILAGFDFMTEVSNATLTKVIKSSVNFNGVLMNPPFELPPVPFAFGSVHLIVRELLVDIEGDDSVTIVLGFAQSSVTLKPPTVPGFPSVGGGTTKTMAPLEGTLSINVALSLRPEPDGTQNVSGDTSTAVVQIVFSRAAETVIASTLAGTPFTPVQFKQAAEDTMTRLVRNQPNQPRIATGLGFRVVPTQDGTVIPSIQLRSLSMRCIGHQDRARQALCLLGNFFVATQNNGNRIQKTETAIEPGQDFATAFSRQVCHELILCPSIARAISAILQRQPALTVPELPTSCGTGGPLDVKGIGLRSLNDTYNEGAIFLSGQVEKSGFCYEATGSFEARVILGIGADRRSLTTNVTVDNVDTDVAVDWYCQLALVAVGGYFQLAIVAAVEDIIEEFANSLALVLLNQELNDSGLAPPGTLVDATRTLSSVSVTPGGIMMQGRIDIPIPFVDTTKFVAIQGSIISTEITGAIQAEWTTKLPCLPEAKAYQYTERQQQQVGSFKLYSKFVTLPLTAQYSIRGSARGLGGLPGSSGPSIPLVVAVAGGAQVTRTVTIPNVECHYPTPLETAGTLVTQDVHLQYIVSGTSVEISNANPAEGNFYVLLEAAVLDGSGAAPAGIDATPELWILFEGDTVEMSGEYVNDFIECEHKSIAKIPLEYIPSRKIGRNPSVAWQTFAVIRGLNEMVARSEASEISVAQLLLHAQNARGGLQGYFTDVPVVSSRALDVGALVTPSREVTAELRSQIQGLSNRLRQLERDAGQETRQAQSLMAQTGPGPRR